MFWTLAATVIYGTNKNNLNLKYSYVMAFFNLFMILYCQYGMKRYNQEVGVEIIEFLKKL